jgi:hypothetical protein
MTVPQTRPLSDHRGPPVDFLAPPVPVELPDDEVERRLPSGWWLIPFSVLGAGIWYLIYRLGRSFFV